MIFMPSFCACLWAKLFLDLKMLYYYMDPFMFYMIGEITERIKVVN